MISSIMPALARLRPAGGMPALPPDLLRNLAPLVVLAAALSALLLMFMWQSQSSYKPIFGGSEKVAAADMMATLDAQGIAYRLHPESGQVLVPESQLGKVRMLLASKGVVAQLPAGLELIDKSDPLGVSQFVQDVRFRRGLEGELAQSIVTLDPVAAARVHVAAAKSSSFVISDGSKSSASVVVTLKPGRTLGAEQIAAIIKLVSGSVASLDPQRVSLVDQAGNLLSAHVDLAEGFDPAHGDEAVRRHREAARASVRDLLGPVLGEHNIKVSVTAEVDNDRIQETRERYGDDPKVISEATREESGRDPLAVGVPGSLSNRPVDVATPRIESEEKTAQKLATTRQFAYDRSVTQVQRGRGHLSKLNVAVILNSAAAPSGNGEWSAAELDGIDRVLRSGLGINTERGDTLVVSAMAFPVAPVALPWWEERDTIIDAVRYGISAFGVLLGYLLVVRPLLRLAQRHWVPVRPPELAPRELADEFSAALDAPEAQADSAKALAAPAVTRDGKMPVVPLLENYDLPPPGSPVDVLVDHLKVLAAKEPERVAEVVKQWVQNNGRSEEYR